jgi:ribosomal protein S18 acetylase RimI-like enzyme
MIEIAPLDHHSRETAEQTVVVQKAGYQAEADLTGYSGMPGLHQDAEATMGLDLKMLGAWDGDELVGVLGYTRHGDLVDVDRLVVHPSHHRRGVARALLDDLHRREHSARRFELMTSMSNTPAISLYLRTGYLIVGQANTDGVDVSLFARSGTKPDDAR